MEMNSSKLQGIVKDRGASLEKTLMLGKIEGDRDLDLQAPFQYVTMVQVSASLC